MHRDRAACWSCARPTTEGQPVIMCTVPRTCRMPYREIVMHGPLGSLDRLTPIGERREEVRCRRADMMRVLHEFDSHAQRSLGCLIFRFFVSSACRVALGGGMHMVTPSTSRSCSVDAARPLARWGSDHCPGLAFLRNAKFPQPRTSAPAVIRLLVFSLD